MQDCSNLLGHVWSIPTPTKVVVRFVASPPEMGEQKISSWGSSAQRPHGKGQWGKEGGVTALPMAGALTVGCKRRSKREVTGICSFSMAGCVRFIK